MSSSPDGKARSCHWTLGDVVDFELALAYALNATDSDATLGRDSRVLAERFPGRALDEVPRRLLFRHWLDLQRERDPSLVGREIDRALRVAAVVAALGGVAAGFLGATGYLKYNGSQPINVMWFVFWLVIFPWCVTAIGGAASYWLRDDAGPQVLSASLAAALSRLSAKHRELWQSWSRALQKHGSRLVPLARWPLFSISNRFAGGFGFGALAALLAHVVGVDLAFGWQSTLNGGAEFVHGLARVFALPWLWIFPSGAPSLEQIRESRFTHLLGIKDSAVAATRAWWPFLAGCLAVYAVAARLLVVGFSEWKRRCALAALDFGRSVDGALARRLSGPMFSPERLTPDGSLGAPVVDTPRPPPSQSTWTLLVAEGLDASDDSIQGKIAGGLRGSVTQSLPVEIDYAAGNQDVLDAIGRSRDRVVVAIDASMDPIEAIRTTLTRLVEVCGDRECVVALLGPEDRHGLWRRWAKARGLDCDIISIPQT